MSDDNLITARGITSQVRDTGHPKEYHVTLLDYDRTARSRVIDDAIDLPGPVGVFESSPGSYHVWCCVVDALDNTALRMLGTKTDPTHISVGYRRGRWTLRVGEKTRRNSSTGESEGEYKSPPEPVTMCVNETARPVSRPHTVMLADRFGYDIGKILDRAEDRSGGLWGDQKRVSEYVTLTDEEKHDR